MFFSDEDAILQGAREIAKSNRELAQTVRGYTYSHQQNFINKHTIEIERMKMEKESQVNLENYKKDVVKCLFEIVNGKFNIKGGECFYKPYLVPDLCYNYQSLGRDAYLLKNKNSPVNLYRLQHYGEDNNLLDSLKDTIKNLDIQEAFEKPLTEEDIFK